MRYKKARQNILSIRNNFKCEDSGGLKAKRMEKVNQKKVGIAMLILDKADFMSEIGGL